MAECLDAAFGSRVSINWPYRGGYVIRSHAGELPWMQVEISRSEWLSEAEKRDRFERALIDFCRQDI